MDTGLGFQEITGKSLYELAFAELWGVVLDAKKVRGTHRSRYSKQRPTLNHDKQPTRASE